MPTLREVITDIHANPAAYTTAFPATEPEPIEYPALNPPSEGLDGAAFAPEMFDRVQASFRELYGLTNPGPPPLTATGVQIQEQNQRFINEYMAEVERRVNVNAYNRLPRGLPVYIDREASPNEMRVYEGGRQVGSVVNLGPPVFPPRRIYMGEISGDGSGALGYRASRTAFEVDSTEPEPPAPSTDRFYLDDSGELQFGVPGGTSPVGPITRMPCGCMRTDCTRCGSWLVPYPTQPL